LLNEAFSKQPWAYWQERMRRAGVPCGLIRTVGEAIRSDEAQERRIVTRIADSNGKWLPNVAMPIRYAGTPLADPVRAPTVGEHTKEVLREVLGYDDDRITALAKSGIFGSSGSLVPAAEPT